MRRLGLKQRAPTYRVGNVVQGPADHACLIEQRLSEALNEGAVADLGYLCAAVTPSICISTHIAYWHDNTGITSFSALSIQPCNTSLVACNQVGRVQLS